MFRKACVITSVHSPFDLRIFHKQSKTLVKAGYDVTLIAQHDKEEVVDGVRIIALPKPRDRFWRLLGTFRILKLASMQKADVYHFHDPELLLVGLLLKLLTRGKIIYDVHEDYPKAILTKHWLLPILRKPIAHLFDVLEKLIASQFACVVAATDEIAGKFLNTNTSIVAIIKNYPIIEMIEPTSKKDPEKAILIYAGGLSKERGITEIVQAIANLNSSRDVKLILCGWFEPETYQISVKSLRGFSRVEYLGYIEPERVWQKMAEATIGIVCLHPEERYTVALPVKLFEYMAAGLPVIASNFPLWKQIVEGNNCGITVNPLDHKEIAKAIDFLLMFPEKAQTMGENGRKAVLEKFNWESEGKKLMDVYGTILSGGKNNFS